MEDGVAAARAMVVIPPSSELPKEERWKVCKDRALAMSEAMNRHRIQIGMEFLGPRYMRTQWKYEFILNMPEAFRFCGECGPNWGVMLDAWHSYHSGGTLGDIATAGKARIVSVHVSDAISMPPEEVRDNMRRMPGEGRTINLTGFCQALKAINYMWAVDPEPLGWMHSGKSIEEGAQMALDTTAGAMKRAGLIIKSG
jgi:sugar phosphate isomerase/epimerase